MKYADIDMIYQTLPLETIPWYSETPPDALVKLVEEGIVQPCKAVDLGCGAGSYAIYLAGLGFDVTGVDTPLPRSGSHRSMQKSGVPGAGLWLLTCLATSMK